MSEVKTQRLGIKSLSGSEIEDEIVDSETGEVIKKEEITDAQIDESIMNADEADTENDNGDNEEANEGNDE